MARQLPADQPVYALQAAGLYGGRAPQTEVKDMAALYLDEIATVQPQGPYRIGGYCFGALVAYEMAAQLQSRGEEVELLISFNGPSPSYLRRYKPLFGGEGALTNESGEVVREAAWQAAAGLSTQGQRPGAARRLVRRFRWRLRRLPRRARIEAALRLRRPLPDDLREAGVFQLIAARAQDRYQPGRVRADMVVVSGEGLYYREDVGWGDDVDGNVEVVLVSGAHLTPRASMRADAVGPIVAAVAERLKQLDPV